MKIIILISAALNFSLRVCNFLIIFGEERKIKMRRRLKSKWFLLSGDWRRIKYWLLIMLTSCCWTMAMITAVWSAVLTVKLIDHGDYMFLLNFTGQLRVFWSDRRLNVQRSEETSLINGINWSAVYQLNTVIILIDKNQIRCFSNVEVLVSI